MEKILVWIVAVLIVICVATTSFAGGGATMMMVGGGPPPAAGGGDSCTGDLVFAWHMENIDVTAGTPAGCSQDATKTFTYFSGFTLSSTQKLDGTNAAYRAGADDYATIPLTGMGTGQMYISWWMYHQNIATGSLVLFRLDYDADNYIVISQTSAEVISFQWFSTAGTDRTVTTTGAMADATGYNCWAYANPGTDPELSVGCDGGITTGTQVNTVSAMAGAPNLFTVGDNNAVAMTTYTDNVYIYNIWNP